MKQGASLGVLLPTRDCAALLPGHLAAMSEWLELAEEVVVVDSFSTDGTQEVLRRTLKHPHLRFVSHPPGLYASWNAGIQQLRSKYTYISTVGDTITRAGLGQLLETAVSCKAGVVISKPAFKRPDGSTASLQWPIDDAIQTLRITAPRPLQQLQALVLAAVHPNTSLTGSCASDLFRTDMLQRAPFPTDCGSAGDGVWCLRQAAAVAWAIVPDRFSTFLLHSARPSQTENRSRPAALRQDVVVREAMAAWRSANLVRDDDLARIGWDELISALSGYLDAKTEFDRRRKANWPWSLNPWSWRARVRRAQRWERLHCLKNQALRALAETPTFSFEPASATASWQQVDPPSAAL